MSCLSTIIDADSVDVVDSAVEWQSANGSGHVRLSQVLFVIEPAEQRSEYLVCSLAEEPEDREGRFRLVILRTRQLPQQFPQQLLIEHLPKHLRHDADNEVDIIVSVKSGMEQAVPFWEQVLRPLLQLFAGENDETNRPGHRLLVTQSADSICDFSRGWWAAESKPSRTVVLLSGDGGIVDLLNGSDKAVSDECLPTLALLPLGTGNALFHSMHKPLYAESKATPLALGLQTLFTGKPAELPVFRASFSPGARVVTFTDDSKQANGTADGPHLKKEEKSVSYLNTAVVASYGFHSTLIYQSDTPEYRLHGSKRFGMVAQELLKEAHEYAAKVQIRRPGSSSLEDVPRDTHTYVLATPLSNLERTFNISPSSKPLDGKLRLIHFGPIGGERTMNVMMKAYDEGKHIGMKWDDGQQVGYEEIEEVKVQLLDEDERWRKVCIDGISVEIPKYGHMSIKKLEQGLFRVLVHSNVLSTCLDTCSGDLV